MKCLSLSDHAPYFGQQGRLPKQPEYFARVAQVVIVMVVPLADSAEAFSEVADTAQRQPVSLELGHIDHDS